MLGDLLRLVRAPLAATAIANGVTGYLLTTVRIAERAPDAEASYPSVLTHESLGDWRPLALTAVASTALYWSGMALNDYFDLERDKKLYPFRPLPSGKVAPGVALLLGLALMAAGVAVAFLAGGGRAAIMASGTAGAIVAYDAFLKRWRLPGCAAMAACRAGNVLLGATIGLAHLTLGRAGASNIYEPYAIAVAVYIFSVTLLSTFENEDAPPQGIALGFLGVLMIPIALAVKLRSGAPFFAAHAALGALLAGRAAKRGTRATGHVTTRWLLRSLLLLDAGMLAGCGLDGWPRPWALIVLALIVPNLVGAKLLFSRGRPSAAPAAAS